MSQTTIKKLLFNFSTLADLSEEITSVKDFKGVMKSSLYLLLGTIPVSKGSILKYNHLKGTLEVLASKGIKGDCDYSFSLNRHTITALQKENSVFSYNPRRKLFKEEKENWKKFSPRLIIPMVIKDELIGVITLGSKFSKDSYTEDDFTLLSIITKYIGISLHNYHLMTSLSAKVDENKKLYEELQSIYYDTIQSLAAAIDAKDPYTKGHSYRVSNYCEAIGKELAFTKKELEGIKIAGFLHDIGKIAVDKEIINKPAALTMDEYKEMYQHPLLSYEMLSRIRFPWKNIASSVRYHHERVDGTGYPDQLTGIEIPLMAKIMAVADAFDAMTTDRPYKKRLSLSDAIKEVRNCVGKQFDPLVAQGLFEFIKKDIKGDDNSERILNWVNFNFNPNATTKILNSAIDEISISQKQKHSSL